MNHLWLRVAAASTFYIAAMLQGQAQSLSPDADVLGVKLGVTMHDAITRLRPTILQEQTLQAQLGGFSYGYTDVGMLLRLKFEQRDALEKDTFNKLFPGQAMAPDGGATLNAMFAPRDDLSLIFKLEAPEQRIVAMTRNVKFPSHAKPLGTVFGDALVTKYGPPLQDSKSNGYRTMVWMSGALPDDTPVDPFIAYNERARERTQMQLEKCLERHLPHCEHYQEQLKRREPVRDTGAAASRQISRCLPMLQRAAHVVGHMNALMRRPGDGTAEILEYYEGQGLKACGHMMRIQLQIDQIDEVYDFTLELADISEAMEGMRSYKNRGEAEAKAAEERRRQDHMVFKPKL